MGVYFPLYPLLQILEYKICSHVWRFGMGKAMIEWAINSAKQRNAHLLQLTTDKQRKGAIEFYKDNGFQMTHEGMKLHL